MSEYTGKEPCVYSEFTMFGDGTSIEEQLKHCRIYWKGKIIDIKTEKELVPYYANMIGMLCGVHEDGVLKRSLHFSEVPYFLSQDWEWTERIYKDIQRIWRYCHRKSIPFTFEYVQKKSCYNEDEALLRNIVNDISEHPHKKYVRGTYHSRWMHRYRELLMETMKEYGYTNKQINEWVWNGRRTW